MINIADGTIVSKSYNVPACAFMRFIFNLIVLNKLRKNKCDKNTNFAAL